MKATLHVALAAALCSWGCDRLPGTQPKQEQGAATDAGHNEVRALIDSGQADAALSRLADASGPDASYLKGLAWAKKAQAAAPVPGGMNPEQLEALTAFEQAIAAKPELADAQLALAELLAPLSKERFAPPPPGRKRPAKPATQESPPPGAQADVSPERVIGAYRAAVQADKGSLVAIRKLVAFAGEMQRFDDAEWAFRERLARQKEKAEPHVAFGDFLAGVRGDRARAIAQYQLGLVWSPDDATIKERIAEIYIAIGDEHLEKGALASAEAAFTDAQKWVPPGSSFSAVKVRDALGRLRAMRAR
jgi:hypothetical protein